MLSLNTEKRAGPTARMGSSCQIPPFGLSSACAGMLQSGKENGVSISPTGVSINNTKGIVSTTNCFITIIELHVIRDDDAPKLNRKK